MKKIKGRRRNSSSDNGIGNFEVFKGNFAAKHRWNWIQCDVAISAENAQFESTTSLKIKQIGIFASGTTKRICFCLCISHTNFEVIRIVLNFIMIRGVRHTIWVTETSIWYSFISTTSHATVRTHWNETSTIDHYRLQ